MIASFDIAEFNRRRGKARQANRVPVRAMRMALAETIPPHVLYTAPRLAVALLTFCDDALNQAEQDTLCSMNGREIASVFNLDRHPPGAFASMESARAAIREWLRPHVLAYLDGHREFDRDLGWSETACDAAERSRLHPAIPQED